MFAYGLTTVITIQALVPSTSASTAQMMGIDEGRFCQDDADCSEKQYCYDVSRQCVDYTQCNRYNRQEAQRFSRHPSQCGPCLPGHVAENLSTGEMAYLCKKVNVEEQVVEPENLNNTLFIWIAAAAAFSFVVMTIVGLILKKRSNTQDEHNHKPWDGVCVIGPSAPPAEHSPFIASRDHVVHAPFNNNHNLKDKNYLVCANPFKGPHWVRQNPNYECTLSNDNLNGDEQSHSLAQLPPADTNSNSWPAEQLAIQVAGASLTEYGIEQIDNSMNAVLVQRCNSSASDETESNNINNNRGTDNGTGANNNNPSNNNDSTSEPNGAQDNRERVRASNIMITQKISMNVNVLNGDC